MAILSSDILTFVKSGRPRFATIVELGSVGTPAQRIPADRAYAVARECALLVSRDSGKSCFPGIQKIDKTRMTLNHSAPKIFLSFSLYSIKLNWSK